MAWKLSYLSIGFALPGAWEKIDSSTVNQMKIFWLTCFGVTKFIEELLHDATKYVLEIKKQQQNYFFFTLYAVTPHIGLV